MLNNGRIWTKNAVQINATANTRDYDRCIKDELYGSWFHSGWKRTVLLSCYSICSGYSLLMRRNIICSTMLIKPTQRHILVMGSGSISYE